MEYVYHEGAVLRRNAQSRETEVWHANTQQWVRYGEAQDWFEGRPISEAEARELMKPAGTA